MITIQKNESILIEPVFGYTKMNGEPYKPSLCEVFIEYIKCLNCFKDSSRKMVPIWIGFHILTFFCFTTFLIQFLSFKNAIFVILAVSFLGTVYNTIWYHRYCSHQSFEFSNRFWQLVFLWTNPSVLREESYAIPHQIHHRMSDKAGDPYGPHLGWLGNYLAQESVQKLNTNISENYFERLKKSIAHIGLSFNSYEGFKKNGSFENEFIYLIRICFSQTIWALLFFRLGGFALIIAWYAAIFVYTFLMRDFNWRGHGGNFRFNKKEGWEFYKGCRALNQHFYGYIAGEWHDNHHLYPASANNAFLSGQVDIAFLLIRLMKRFRIVKSYFNLSGRFQSQYLNKV